MSYDAPSVVYRPRRIYKNEDRRASPISILRSQEHVLLLLRQARARSEDGVPALCWLQMSVSPSKSVSVRYLWVSVIKSDDSPLGRLCYCCQSCFPLESPPPGDE